jgi:hypothetical protein
VQEQVKLEKNFVRVRYVLSRFIRPFKLYKAIENMQNLADLRQTLPTSFKKRRKDSPDKKNFTINEDNK